MKEGPSLAISSLWNYESDTWLINAMNGGMLSDLSQLFFPAGVYTRVGWKVHMLSMKEWSNLIKCDLLFQHSLPWGPHTSSIGVAVLGFPWYRSSHPDPKKESSTSDTTSSILCPSQVLFHVGEQKIVRWCQIRRIWKVINEFKATVTHSSHCNHRLVCRRALSSWNRTCFVSFPGHFEMSLVLL